MISRIQTTLGFGIVNAPLVNVASGHSYGIAKNREWRLSSRQQGVLPGLDADREWGDVFQIDKKLKISDAATIGNNHHLALGIDCCPGE